jgi:LysR family transcriptional regulator for metE and metH
VDIVIQPALSQRLAKLEGRLRGHSTIGMVASGEGISVLPQWVAAPCTAGESLRVAMVQIGARPTRRTWHLATRRGELHSTIADLADLLAQRFASQPGTNEST